MIGRKTPPDILERDLKKYINWYNNVRIKRRLGGSSPGECRLSQPLDSLLLPFRKRGPLQKRGVVKFELHPFWQPLMQDC